MFHTLKSKIITSIILVIAFMVTFILFINNNSFEKIIEITNNSFDSILSNVSKSFESMKNETNNILNTAVKSETENMITNTENFVQKSLNDFNKKIINELALEARKSAISEITKKINSKESFIKNNIQTYIYNYVKSISMLPSIKNFYDLYEYDLGSAESIANDIGTFLYQQIIVIIKFLASSF
ncbi:hypothetical protein [Marinitoga lauensis]|uniref:hypothetical protein n=1 Tax=Marinitoga lauensis TaxID=2201189 RepID=UPI00101013A4|nr:hypothetical protein [Marinitoga lauensis]